MAPEIRPDLTDADFVRLMPKVELHVHLEGTIAPATQLAIAERNGIELPYDSPEGVAEYQAKRRSDGRENLVNFLDCLDISRGVLRTADDFHTITMEFLARCRAEGVDYVEIMFDPQQAIRQGVPSARRGGGHHPGPSRRAARPRGRVAADPVLPAGSSRGGGPGLDRGGRPVPRSHRRRRARQLRDAGLPRPVRGGVRPGPVEGVPPDIALRRQSARLAPPHPRLCRAARGRAHRPRSQRGR